MIVLGIETSCDETSAAVVRDGREVLSCVVHTQEQHRPFGGVVPEIASRCHVRLLPGIAERAVAESGVGWEGIDLIAATRSIHSGSNSPSSKCCISMPIPKRTV